MARNRIRRQFLEVVLNQKQIYHILLAYRLIIDYNSTNMFQPRYAITNKLLTNIKQINSLIIELNNKKFPKTVLYNFEKKAQIISTYASTSIEGNPLPLTDVKKILKSQ